MARLTFVVLIVAMIAGCGGRPDVAGTPADPAPATSGDISVAGGAKTSEVFVAPEPVPFESIALASDSSYATSTVAEGGQPGEVREFTALKIKFCWCPPGSFQMGSRDNAPGNMMNERQHEVILSKGFWMQQTELTQDQYEQLMGSNPAFFKGAQNPVESVTWDEATEYCRRLSELPPEKNAGNLFRLPTEAEWEYACRAGSDTEWCCGDDETVLDDYCWYNKNSARTTHPVGEKKPNSWGLHDMHGNVSEWCQDLYGEYPRDAVTDPRGSAAGESRRNLRGGGWFFVSAYARSAYRDAHDPADRYVGRGFRLVATSLSLD